MHWLITLRHTLLRVTQIKPLLEAHSTDTGKPLPKLPGKNLFGSSEKLVETRRYQLSLYIKNLLRDFDRITTTSTFQSFLDLQSRLASVVLIMVCCCSSAVAEWRLCQHCLPLSLAAFVPMLR